MYMRALTRTSFRSIRTLAEPFSKQSSLTTMAFQIAKQPPPLNSAIKNACEFLRGINGNNYLQSRNDHSIMQGVLFNEFGDDALSLFMKGLVNFDKDRDTALVFFEEAISHGIKEINPSFYEISEEFKHQIIREKKEANK